MENLIPDLFEDFLPSPNLVIMMLLFNLLWSLFQISTDHLQKRFLSKYDKYTFNFDLLSLQLLCTLSNIVVEKYLCENNINKSELYHCII